MSHVLQIVGWELESKALFGRHLGEAHRLEPEDQGVTPCYELESGCSGDFHAYYVKKGKVAATPGPDCKMRFHCSTCNEEFVSGFYAPDVISEWCWTAALAYLWQTMGEQYNSLALSPRYTRVTAGEAFLLERGRKQKVVLEYRQWAGAPTTLLISGFEGDFARSIVHAHLSALECTEGKLKNLRELVDKIRSSRAWGYPRPS